MRCLATPSREDKAQQSRRQVSEFMSLSFDMVEPPAQLGLTCRMLVFLRSLSDKLLYWEGRQRFAEHKFELLNLSDLQMAAIGDAIERARFLIDEKTYRSAFQEMCTVRQYFDAHADHSITGTYANDGDAANVSKLAVYNIPPVPRLDHESVTPLAGCPLHAVRLGPTPVLPTQNSFIHFGDAGVPVPPTIDLKRSSTVPAEASRSWDDNSAEVSTCDGDAVSEAEASDTEIAVPTLMSSFTGCPAPEQQHWQAQQQSSSSTGGELMDVNTWGPSLWPSQCTPEANRAMAAWAQQFCLPGFSVQMMGIVPVDADGHSLHAGTPNPVVADNFVAVPSPPVMEHQRRSRGRDGNACCFVFEHKASSSRTMDTSIVKKCNLEVGNFTVTISPKRATLKKGGSSFRASKGQCTAQVKCNSEARGEFTLAVGLGNAPALITVRHDFSRDLVCSIPGVVDLKNAMDENASLFRLTFEFTVV